MVLLCLYRSTALCLNSGVYLGNALPMPSSLSLRTDICCRYGNQSVNGIGGNSALVGDVNLDALERLANMGGFSDLSNLDLSDLEAIASLLNG